MAYKWQNIAHMGLNASLKQKEKLLVSPLKKKATIQKNILKQYFLSYEKKKTDMPHCHP